MKMHKFFGLLAFAAIAVFVSSCTQDDEDEEAPVISIIAPGDHGDYEAGDMLQYRISFSDNEDLSEYHIDIHVAGGHDHGKRDEIEWDHEEVGQLSGVSQTIEGQIEIPSNAAHGEYHFNVECTDAAGNEANFALVEFHIEEE